MSVQTGLNPVPQFPFALPPATRPEALEPFVQHAGQLFTLPAVAVEILDLTSQPKVDLTKLKQCLLRDPALIGKLLRVVNSSLFGLSREVADLNQALALLGTKSLRLLVLGFSLPDKLFVGLGGHVLQRYWHFTAIKAAASREIAETIFRIPGDEAFIAGLLQDLGMLALMQQIGEPYIKFLERGFAKAVDIGGAEVVALGFDHVQLTAQLLSRWGLPESLVAAIGAGSNPERIAKVPVSRRDLAQVLHLADLLAGMLMEGRVDWLGRLRQVGQQYRQLSTQQLSAVVDRLQGKVKQLAEVLSLELPDGVDYCQLYHQAHAALAAAAEDAAIELARSQAPVSMQSDSGAYPTNDEALASETTRLIEAVRRFTHTTHNQLQPTAASIKIDEPERGGNTPPSSAPSPSSRAAKTEIASSATIESDAANKKSAEAQTAEGQSVTPAMPELSASGDTESDILLFHSTRRLAACRQARKPLTLILVEVDRQRADAPQSNAEDIAQFVQLVGLVCGKIDHPQATQLNLTENRLSILLPNCDRPAARAFGHMILDEVRRLCARSAELTRAKLTVSVGVATAATPAKNFLAQSLIASADRCLQTAQLCGGNAVKSIDVL